MFMNMSSFASSVKSRLSFVGLVGVIELRVNTQQCGGSGRPEVTLGSGGAGIVRLLRVLATAARSLRRGSGLGQTCEACPEEYKKTFLSKLF